MLPEVEEEDDAAEDAKWGLSDEAPLVGVGAPPVVAVVVTRDPGDWFEECLESLDAQDYENLSVLVIDNGSKYDPTHRVAEILPTGFVKRIGEDRGFSAAANEVLVSVEGAPFFLFLHDDVRLAPEAVTTLVAEAFRANAGVVGPKLVDWDDPQVLRSVGLAVDAYGASAPLVDPGEIDQSQHDIARNVFAVSSACMLVRADLFAAVGGFSPEIPYFGEDVDLCWRVHAAGAAVQFSPRAVVGHREQFGERREVESRSRFEVRHESRMVLANTELRRWLWVMPIALVLGLVDFIGSLVVGRFRRCGDIVAAFVWNFVHLPDLVRARARVRRSRRVHDADYRELVHRGSFRLRSLVRSDEGESRLAAATRTGRGYFQDLTSTTSRVAAALLVATIVLAVLGARGLITGPVPVMREFVSGGSSASALLSEWWTAWRGAGLGEPSVPPGVVPGLGAVGTLLLGSIGLARRLLVLVPLLVGGIGAWKLLAGTRSVRGRAAALAVYVLNPVALNAMATGRLQALVTYAAAPWLLRRIAARAGVAPFAGDGATRTPVLRHLAGNALILGAVGSVSPLGALILVGSVSVLAVAPVVAGQRNRALRLPAAAVGGLVLALPLLAPWLVESFRHGDVSSLTGIWAGRSPAASAADILTGSVGPVQVGVLGWGILVAALVPLVTGRSWRLGWATGGWVLALGSWLLTITMVRADNVAGAGAELLLVPAALGIMLAVAMGPLAFEEDVVSGDFGLSQVLSGVAIVALVVGLVPVAVAASDGRWYQPEGDFERALRIVDDGTDFRTLWIGDPDVLPLSGWVLPDSGGVAVGVSEGFDPVVTQRYRLDGGAGVASIRQAVEAALAGRTSRLGQLLAPMGIRYVLVVDRPAPEPFAAREVPPPVGTLAALGEQLDLSELPVSPGAYLFKVSSSWPLRSDVTALQLPPNGAPTPADQLRLPPSSPPAVLGRDPGTSFTGRVVRDHSIAQAVTADPGWALSVGGTDARRSDLFGWGQQFAVPSSGQGALAWSTSLASRLLQLVQIVALVGLIYLAGRRRRLASPTPRRRIIRREAPIVVVAAADTVDEAPIAADEVAAESVGAEEVVIAGPGGAPVDADDGSTDPDDGDAAVGDAAVGDDLTADHADEAAADGAAPDAEADEAATDEAGPDAEADEAAPDEAAPDDVADDDTTKDGTP